MILSDLKGYLEARGQATLADMALHLRAEPEAVRAMLSVWERKGRVRRLPDPGRLSRHLHPVQPGGGRGLSLAGGGGTTGPGPAGDLWVRALRIRLT